MAYQTIWTFSDLPEKVVDAIVEDIEDTFGDEIKESLLMNSEKDVGKRNSRNAWVPTTHWSAGFVWNYIMRANRENFLYDITGIDGDAMQYTLYGPGEFYGWHPDQGLSSNFVPQNPTVSCGKEKEYIETKKEDYLTINTEIVRKISFSLQLSSPDDYEGGNLQLMDDSGRSYIAPRNRGAIIMFDARTRHRVQKVKSGERKSLVGWICGPRWR